MASSLPLSSASEPSESGSSLTSKTCPSGDGGVGGAVQRWWGVAYRKENGVPGLSPPRRGVCDGEWRTPADWKDSVLVHTWHFLVTGAQGEACDL